MHLCQLLKFSVQAGDPDCVGKLNLLSKYAVIGQYSNIFAEILVENSQYEYAHNCSAD